MKNTLIKLLASIAITLPVQLVVAQTSTTTTESAKTTSDMAEGEVRKVDKETKKITLRHGVIKNLDMPAMTMVFQVKDAALLDKLKAGDKIRFSADKVDGAYTVLSAEPRP
jgi:Cu(I)/Ag(I) efflux system periplasmic protein CusF